MKTLQESIFSLDNMDLIYDPFPIALARKVFKPSLYDELTKTFPPVEQFKFIEYLGNKYSLSEVNNPHLYYEFISSYPCWKSLYDYFKSRDFIYYILSTLYHQNIDLGAMHLIPPKQKYYKNVIKRNFKSLLNSFSRTSEPQLKTRFEFSMLPANGGHIKPHTDHPTKIVTLIFSMNLENEWDSAFGGGTETLKPKNIKQSYNYMNRQLEFEEVETLQNYPFNPNQCLLFVKTFNSLHAVRPMTGPERGLMRKTLTVNIEKL